jgi:mono/diheme cytochrome c family protein
MAAWKRLFAYASAVWFTASGGIVAAVNNAPDLAASVARETRSITLPHFEPDLPIAPGRDEFMMVCASCHSPRYVTMQPPFAEGKWTEEVDKMSKTYGAQMDADQRRAIIGYLVAINGPGSRTTSGASPGDDDEAGSSTKTSLPRYVETTPHLTFSADPAEAREEIKRGADIFTQDCSGCHGATGRGDGFINPVLFRKAENLAASRYSEKLVSRILWNGKRGTSMPSWRGLPAADLAAVVKFVETLHPHNEPEHIPAETIQHGRQLFLHNCAPCHGESADGNGVNAVTLLPPPANFRLKQPDLNYILLVLREGIPGTAMPSWKDRISESDRRALAAFVRSLYEPNEHNANPQSK